MSCDSEVRRASLHNLYSSQQWSLEPSPGPDTASDNHCVQYECPYGVLASCDGKAWTVVKAGGRAVDVERSLFDVRNNVGCLPCRLRSCALFRPRVPN